MDLLKPYPDLDHHDTAATTSVLIEEPHAYLLSVADWLGQAGVAVPEYYTEPHTPADHFLRIPVERAVVDLGWNAANDWFYLVHIGGGPASTTGAVAVDPA